MHNLNASGFMQVIGLSQTGPLTMWVLLCIIDDNVIFPRMIPLANDLKSAITALYLGTNIIGTDVNKD